MNILHIKPDTENQDNLPMFPSVFLAGTIDMGNSEDWQSKVFDNLMKDNAREWIVFNPRRICMPDSIDEQVNWEQDHLEESNIIFMRLTGDKSPISLLEFGQFIESGKMIVVCDPTFYRYDNIRIMCDRNKVPLFHTFEAGYKMLKVMMETINPFTFKK